MMKMKKNIYAVILAALVLHLPAAAQNLDPTVHVNRAYQGKLMEVHKPSLDMAVPDTLTRFDLDFDYSVFDSPYKGSYEFKPYVLDLQPSADAGNVNRFWLKAGAGYPLYPVFDLVWAPFAREGFKMDVYASNRSYAGRYRKFAPDGVQGNVIDRWTNAADERGLWKGYDVLTEVGVDGRYDWKKGVLGFDVSYYGVATDDELCKRMYDALDVEVALASKADTSSLFSYAAGIGYRFAEDKLEYMVPESSYMSEHVFDLDASIASNISDEHSVHFDVGLQMAAYAHALQATACELSFVPHYKLNKGRWSADIGLRIAKVLRSSETSGLFSARDQIVYPDVTVDFAVIPDAMKAYVRAGGGNRLNTYASLIDRNHFVTPVFGRDAWSLLDCTVERVSAAAGVEGRISSRFTYDLSVGYVNYANDLLEAVRTGVVMPSEGERYLPGYGYAGYQKAFASLDWIFETDPVRFDGTLTYAHTWGMTGTDGLFLPAAFTGDFAARYDWNDRIFVGLDCVFSTGRHGSVLPMDSTKPAYDAVIRGYADVGVEGIFAVNHFLSLWTRVGNILNMTVQHNPVYAESGVNFNVGLSLSF